MARKPFWTHLSTSALAHPFRAPSTSEAVAFFPGKRVTEPDRTLAFIEPAVASFAREPNSGLINLATRLLDVGLDFCVRVRAPGALAAGPPAP